MPIASNADMLTPLTLIDATAASGQGPVLYSVYLCDVTAFLYALKPASVPVTPGSPAAPPAGTLMQGANIPFAAGLFVRSCPAHVTFAVTT
jgi:hypothetical protein